MCDISFHLNTPGQSWCRRWSWQGLKSWPFRDQCFLSLNITWDLSKATSWNHMSPAFRWSVQHSCVISSMNFVILYIILCKYVETIRGMQFRGAKNVVIPLDSLVGDSICFTKATHTTIASLIARALYQKCKYCTAIFRPLRAWTWAKKSLEVACLLMAQISRRPGVVTMSWLASVPSSFAKLEVVAIRRPACSEQKLRLCN